MNRWTMKKNCGWKGIHCCSYTFEQYHWHCVLLLKASHVKYSIVKHCGCTDKQKLYFTFNSWWFTFFQHIPIMMLWDVSSTVLCGAEPVMYATRCADTFCATSYIRITRPTCAGLMVGQGWTDLRKGQDVDSQEAKRDGKVFEELH